MNSLFNSFPIVLLLLLVARGHFALSIVFRAVAYQRSSRIASYTLLQCSLLTSVCFSKTRALPRVHFKLSVRTTLSAENMVDSLSDAPMRRALP